LNPFLLARLELVSPRPADEAWRALEQLVHDGLDDGGRHYRLFGGRHGRAFSMSLGLPFLGGSAPVLRAYQPGDSVQARFDVTVGARVELIVFTAFWLLLTVLGGSYQLILQSSAVVAGRAPASAVLEVLPGIGIMAGLLALGLWLFRRRAARDAEFLVHGFRRAIGAATPDADGPPPFGVGTPPFH
jgi:hypothetical protein